jgi:catechol 2,3-dioxygenase-like lactoylglutathione lyase family enzyme
MIDLVQLHHVSFATRDLEASKRFFGGVIGLAEIQRPGFGFAGAWYAIGDRQLHLIQEQGSGPEAGERISRSDHMALEVRDVEAVKKTLGENGVEFTAGGNQALGMDQVFCRDPDGHVIEFVQYRTS